MASSALEVRAQKSSVARKVDIEYPTNVGRVTTSLKASCLLLSSASKNVLNHHLVSELLFPFCAVDLRELSYF